MRDPRATLRHIFECADPSPPGTTRGTVDRLILAWELADEATYRALGWPLGGLLGAGTLTLALWAVG